MTRFQVDSDDMAAATAAVRGSMARIASDVGGMHSRLVQLQGTWTGSASVSFQGVVSDWRSTQQRVEQSLSTINLALDRAAQQYAEAEASNTRLFVV